MWGHRGFGERPGSVLLGLVLLGCGGTTIEEGDAITLSNVCQRLPAEYCAQDAPCCRKAGFSFDRAACEENYRTWCSQEVGTVSAGKATFHSEKIFECLTAVQPSYDVCLLDGAGFETLATRSVVCFGIFAGVTKMGQPCEDPNECVDIGTFGSYCDTTKGACAEVPPLPGVGDSCDVDVGCAPSLTCDLSTNTCDVGPPTPIVTELGCSGNDSSPVSAPSDGGF